MLKKFIPAAISIAALLAFAAPAAQATGPLITDSNGAAATTVTAVSTNTITHTSVGTLECTTTILHINITTNANTTAKGSGTGHATGTPAASGAAKHEGHCSSSSGPIVEVTSWTISDLHLTKHGTETTGTLTLSKTYHIKSAPTPGNPIAECTFGGTVPVTKTGANKLNVNGKITKTAGSAFCPTESTITGDFTVTDHLGFPAPIH